MKLLYFALSCVCVFLAGVLTVQAYLNRVPFPAALSGKPVLLLSAAVLFIVLHRRAEE